MTPDLQPGDGIVYTGSNLFDDIEKVKLGSDATHFEIYIGGGMVITSLMETGVGIYPECGDSVIRVLRPVAPFSAEHAIARFRATIDGLPYGTSGLLNFTDNNIADRGLFCSQVGILVYRSQGIEPFNSKIEARRVSPMHYLYVSELVLKTVWTN